jgi:hypothetical protein
LLHCNIDATHPMYLIVIAWLYVALMMAVAEATSPVGTVLGAIITFVLYGVGPVALLIYLMGHPGRRRARLQRERQELERERAGASGQPDAGREAPADPVAPVRKEP